MSDLPAPVVVFERTGPVSGGAGEYGDLVSITIPGKLHGLFNDKPIEIRLKVSPALATELTALTWKELGT